MKKQAPKNNQPKATEKVWIVTQNDNTILDVFGNPAKADQFIKQYDDPSTIKSEKWYVHNK